MKNYVLNYWLCALLLLVTLSCSDINDELSDNQTDQSSKNTSAFTERGELIELPNGTKVLKSGERYIFEGDILLTKEQVEIIGSKSELRSTITTDIAKKWPNNTVYYTINSSLSSTNREYVRDAIWSWSQNTNISFIPWTTETDYVEFVQGSMGTTSSSDIGKTGKRQEIILGNPLPGTVTHEIGHAVGLYHEHTRPDRDNYITMKPENIALGYEINFALAPVNSNHGPFDFNSIMLYDSYLFSKNNGPTMVKKDGTTFGSQDNGLSAGDIAGINSMYPPNYNLSTLVSDIGVLAGVNRNAIIFSTKNITNWQSVSVTSFPSWITKPTITQKNKTEGTLSFTVSSTWDKQVGEIILTQTQSNKQLKLPLVQGAYPVVIQMGNVPFMYPTARISIKVNGVAEITKPWGLTPNSKCVMAYIRPVYSEESYATILLSAFVSNIKGYTSFSRNLSIVSGGAGYNYIELKGKLKEIAKLDSGIGVIVL